MFNIKNMINHDVRYLILEIRFIFMHPDYRVKSLINLFVPPLHIYLTLSFIHSIIYKKE